ncbi:MAG: protein-L-isoaspartate(D-aspartate) O-methyltransferase, partial [Candidatus Omnitrophica bacterium]|nr:protein-L-isoaspartate(D-aspartate) O-methyltransferase [Candidatus Omnitrophota bacterium]
LPIGYNQTISQPYIVAYMTEVLEISPQDRVLEIGTGSGYQAVILAEVAKEVYTVEILQPLAEKAEALWKELGYQNIFGKVADGWHGWPEYAPYDKIMVTAAPDKIPSDLVDQLKEGGRMVVPVGTGYQELIVGIKQNGVLRTTETIPVRFVPLVHGSTESESSNGE